MQRFGADAAGSRMQWNVAPAQHGGPGEDDTERFLIADHGLVLMVQQLVAAVLYRYVAILPGAAFAP